MSIVFSTGDEWRGAGLQVRVDQVGDTVLDVHLRHVDNPEVCLRIEPDQWRVFIAQIKDGWFNLPAS